MKYFLDTNIISYYLKGKFPAIRDHFNLVPANEIYIPAIVLAEIEYGARKSSSYEETIKVYSKFLKAFPVLSFDERATVYYGQIRAQLEKEGQLIGANDMLIAAIVLAENGVLVTNNVNEFSRIHGLRIENWTE